MYWKCFNNANKSNKWSNNQQFNKIPTAKLNQTVFINIIKLESKNMINNIYNSIKTLKTVLNWKHNLKMTICLGGYS